MATTNNPTNERIEQFKGDVASMGLKSGGADKEKPLLALGVLLMVVGFIVTFVAWQSSLKADDSRDILSYLILSIMMLILTIAGAAMFLRYSLAKFLRFWLLRQLYEGQSHIDQVVEAIKTR